jgi:chemosensory pili system protein ChpA (sensor histidine kinase/response regulator)
MVTSRTTQMHRTLASDAGVNAYMVKPVREDDLLATIHRLITAPSA